MRPLALALLVALPAVGGCSLTRPNDGPGDCICTMEFRTIGVRVVDAAGQPVTGLAVTVTNERTGAVVEVDQDAAGPPAAGSYVVISDAQVQAVSEAGDRLTFRATGGGRVAEATFVVSRDACSCHIEKESGPDEIVAR
jgi:hypothetical protein